MSGRPTDWRCGILDLLEAAALRSAEIEIRRGERWQRLRVSDVVSAQGEDWLVTAEGERVAVSDITAARPIDNA
ncbi:MULTISPECIES: hypothetical protein [unclassified Guyparkeria]|uniref:hypothetical protein n=1 Tax=unclassified Guyparkeria TaxID=2626246 RepID=UPI0012E39124|nr:MULTISPECIES: hypothetical protein [unclassified Guyparkeria]